MDAKEVQRVGCQVIGFLAFLLIGIPIMLLGLGILAAVVGSGN